MQSFAERIAGWFKINARDLPWRKTNDPYKIWISEIMLQQTTVATVIDYYNRFLSRFPTVQALGSAHEDEVLKLWEGLGYYRRARHLHAAARMIISEFGGQFPNSRESILKLPGIGAYSAGAILSIAFRKNEAALDGNLIRVYSRLFRYAEDVSKTAALKQLWTWAKEHTPSDASISREFAEGMMELGATVCLPRNPKCHLCPVSARCEAYKNGDPEAYPIKSRMETRKKIYEEVVIARRNRKVAFLPTGADPKFPHFRRLPFEVVTSEPKKFSWKIKYAVTNRDFTVFIREGKGAQSKKYQWLTEDEIKDILLPAIDRKILKKVLG